MQGRVQGWRWRHSRTSLSRIMGLPAEGRLASQLEVTQIVGVHFTVDLTHQIGAHFHFLGATCTLSEESQVLIQGMGFCLVPAKAGCRPTAAMRRLVMYSTYWQRMSLFRPISGAVLEQVLGPPSPAGPLP